MATTTNFQSYNLKGLNLQLNPLTQNNSNQTEFLQLINMDSQPFGGKTKRPGYGTYLSSLGTKIETLFDWHKDNGTQFWNYAVAGGTLFSSTQGTGAWTVTGNGTVTGGDNIFHGVLANTLMITSPNGTTRHSTTGTSFTDTTSAPTAGVGIVPFQNRMWVAGTANSVSYSTTGTPTDWTTDDGVYNFTGASKLLSAFKGQDRLVVTFTNGNIFRYDGYNATDMATDLGPTSAKSIVNVEDFRFYLNRRGYIGYGNKPTLISNPIQPQIYNNAGSGIVGTVFDSAPSGNYRYDIYTAVGTVTDDFTDETINNCIQKYNFQLDEWANYDFANLPTAYNTYKDVDGVERNIFGDSSGQCYTFGGTATSDNGAVINATMQMVYHAGVPQYSKKWSWLYMFFNPGCEATIQVACEDVFTKGSKKWIDVGQAKNGFVEFGFPPNTRSKLLFIRVKESSSTTPFSYYGLAVDATVEGVNR